MPTTNGEKSSLVTLSLEERYDRIIEVIAESESDAQVAPELFLELAEIVLKLESE